MINTIWSELVSYESVDFLKREFQNLHKKSLKTQKAQEISAHFVQGRNYYESASKSDFLIKPLLLYYGVLALTRGLILFLHPIKQESSLAKSHGLSAKNWAEDFSKNDWGSLKVDLVNGTFKELISVTANLEPVRIALYSRSRYVVGWYSNEFDIDKPFTFSFEDILSRIPELKYTFESVTGRKASVFQGKVFIEQDYGSPIKNAYASFYIKNNTFADSDSELLTDQFIREQLAIDENIASSLTNDSSLPYLSWTFVYPDIKGFEYKYKIPSMAHSKKGDLYFIKPLNNKSLNSISLLFLSSYYCGMLVRYWPTIWRTITTGNINDIYLPLIKNSVQLIEEVYPDAIFKYLDYKHYRRI
ncbi:YaaC family protein [Spirosoma koreense]